MQIEIKLKGHKRIFCKSKTLKRKGKTPVKIELSAPVILHLKNLFIFKII